MKNWPAIRERYLRDGNPVRLGGLAANLARVNSTSSHDANLPVVRSLLEESQWMIEWSAAEFEIDTAAELVQIQLELAGWRMGLDALWNDRDRRSAMAERARILSDRVLELSGLVQD